MGLGVVLSLLSSAKKLKSIWTTGGNKTRRTKKTKIRIQMKKGTKRQKHGTIETETNGTNETQKS